MNVRKGLIPAVRGRATAGIGVASPNSLAVGSATDRTPPSSDVETTATKAATGLRIVASFAEKARTPKSLSIPRSVTPHVLSGYKSFLL